MIYKIKNLCEGNEFPSDEINLCRILWVCAYVSEMFSSDFQRHLKSKKQLN